MNEKPPGSEGSVDKVTRLESEWWEPTEREKDEFALASGAAFVGGVPQGAEEPPEPPPPQPPIDQGPPPPTGDVIPVTGDSSMSEAHDYSDPDPATSATFSPELSPSPPINAPSPTAAVPKWILPAGVAALVVAAAVGVAAARSNAGASPQAVARATVTAGVPAVSAPPSALTASALPLASGPVAAAQPPMVNLYVSAVSMGDMTGSTSFTDPAYGKLWPPWCGQQWRLYIRAEGNYLKLGDRVHLAITRSGLPSELTVTLDDTADKTSGLPGHTAFLGPFAAPSGAASLSVSADTANGVSLVIPTTQTRSYTCNPPLPSHP